MRSSTTKEGAMIRNVKTKQDDDEQKFLPLLLPFPSRKSDLFAFVFVNSVLSVSFLA